jgi:hypothetical protein
MKSSDKPRCGAKNRQGQPCQRFPLTGKGRCALHGGKTPATQNAGATNGNAKNGLYSKALRGTEADHFDTIPLGDVDAEIRMCKIWLARALELDSAVSDDPNSAANRAGLMLAEIRRSASGELVSHDSVTRRPDPILRINVLLGRIAHLEKVRAELIQAAAERGDNPDDKARDIAQALRAMIAVETTPAVSYDAEPDSEGE